MTMTTEAVFSFGATLLFFKANDVCACTVRCCPNQGPCMHARTDCIFITLNSWYSGVFSGSRSTFTVYMHSILVP